MTLRDKCAEVPQDAKTVQRPVAGGQWTPRVELGDCACSANNSAESPDSARNTAGCAP